MTITDYAGFLDHVMLKHVFQMFNTIVQVATVYNELRYSYAHLKDKCEQYVKLRLKVI